jgi:Ni,Fe-hydrogenase I large subunit
MNECCTKDENLKVVELRDFGRLVVRQCGVCSRRHYEALVEPVELKAEQT